VDSARAAVAELQRQGGQINFLLLNAAATTRRPQLNSDGVELTYASTLIGHHVITALALKEGMLAPNARVVIAGSESARGNVPGEQGHDFAQIAEQQFAGDRVAAVEAFLRLAVPAQNDFRNMREYGTAKLFVAWWAASMARRLPPGMTVNAVSPGGALDTNFGRDANAILRYGLLPILRVLGPLTGLSGTVEAGARRYIEAEAYAADQTGNFYATANRKKVAGPVGLQTWPAFFRDEENQEACFEALVKITGVRL
jgi:NAD(P)-dependent dehydrogenase (short-subunit alcohol dehydrogenase family)